MRLRRWFVGFKADRRGEPGAVRRRQENEALRKLVDRLARSYVPGMANSSSDGRALLVAALRDAAAAARDGGNAKGVERARRHRPAIVPGLPFAAQTDFNRRRDEGLA